MDLSSPVKIRRIIPHSPVNYQDCDETTYEVLASVTERFGSGDIVDPHPVGTARVPKDLGTAPHAPAAAVRRSYEKCATAVSREFTPSPIISELESGLEPEIEI